MFEADWPLTSFIWVEEFIICQLNIYYMTIVPFLIKTPQSSDTLHHLTLNDGHGHHCYHSLINRNTTVTPIQLYPKRWVSDVVYEVTVILCMVVDDESWFLEWKEGWGRDNGHSFINWRWLAKIRTQGYITHKQHWTQSHLQSTFPCFIIHHLHQPLQPKKRPLKHTKYTSWKWLMDGSIKYMMCVIFYGDYFVSSANSHKYGESHTSIRYNLTSQTTQTPQIR